RADGVIPAGVRFQVEYPTPLASIGGYIVPEQQQLLLPSYERAMFADLDRLLAAIPADEVAVQWDGAVGGPGTRRDPRRPAPVLRGLWPRALHAARVAGPAGPGGERGRRRGREA